MIATHRYIYTVEKIKNNAYYEIAYIIIHCDYCLSSKENRKISKF